MESQPGCASTTAGLLLFTAAALAWVPSATAQQFSQGAAQASLSPAIHSAFDASRSALSRIERLPFNSEAKQVPGGPQLRLLSSYGTALGLPPSARIANVARARTSVRTRLTGTDSAMAVGRTEFASETMPHARSIERLPDLYEEDTPFSSQMRLPLAHLWSGRVQFDGFCRESSSNTVLNGPAQSRDPLGGTPRGQAPHSETSCGIILSFHKPTLQAKTLCRYLFGEGGK